ncbi:MAG: DndE family protein [Gammaproteobacteria bacterium]|nr:DndE family protein [Gammaproteobacteria bacterium]
MLPNRVKFSKTATDKLRYMKANTGLTPNILARMAIMLALKDRNSLQNAGVADSDGQELNKSVLFGDHAHVYEVMIKQFVHDNNVDQSMQQIISSLVEVGVHKMGHVKSLSDLCDL